MTPLSCARPRPEDGDAALPELVAQPGHERRLGPDDDEVGADRPRELEQAVAVLCSDRVALTELRDARVARRRALTAGGASTRVALVAERLA